MKKDLFYMVVLFLIVLGVGLWVKSWNQIQTDQAVARFAEQANVEESEIEVIRHSNNSLVFGDTHDVTFEMVIKGKPIQGRCTSYIFSPMICRLYKSEE